MGEAYVGTLGMARTKQTARKATRARTTILPDVTHTPPMVEDGLLHTRCREECPLSLLLCRALREMGHRPSPFISVQTVHEEGNCMAQVILPRGTFAGQETLTTYGANEEEVYRKAVMAALTSLSSRWEAGHTVLRFLPTNDLDHALQDRREQLRDRNGSRPLVACMDYAREARGMYHRAENRSHFYFARYTEARTRVEELEAQQRLAEYEPPQQPAPLEEESSEPMEMEEKEENDPSNANSRMVNTRQGQTSG
ncbi:hypothetical protein U9M48_023522 [Paspalum notatum var. saurae]|uniref:Uncharacterized protein n=1 Tax=Paspalum notatum var. saurae TaxID=547442 RepID=A0AAQ3WVV1_PASNO